MRSVTVWIFGAIGAAALVGAEATSPANDKADATPGGHYADIHGLHLYYEIAGEGAPLLILHGGLSASPAWPSAVEFFRKNHRIIAPVQMGHGRTADNMSRRMDYHDMAEDTVELLRRLGVTRVDVIGFSDGGDVALDLAIHHPDLIGKAAVSGANRSPDKPALPANVFKPEDAPALREAYVAVSPDGPDHYVTFFHRVTDMWATQPNFTDAELRGIKAHFLVIAGDHDAFSPEATVELWRLIPQAQLWIIPDATHLVPFTKPEIFNAGVERFLQGN
jgi:pimeloyl-ACP methyl ester carboxylesterase